jgi:hypothetical protein
MNQVIYAKEVRQREQVIVEPVKSSSRKKGENSHLNK